MKIRQKTNLLKLCASKAFVFLLISVLFGSYLAILLPQQASAAGSYAYTDKNHTAISGPLPNGGSQYDSNNNLVYTFKYTKDKSGNGKYVSFDGQGFNNDSETCTPYIQTASKKYDGSKNATTWTTCIGGGLPQTFDKHSITIGDSTSFNIKGSWLNHNDIQVGNTVYHDNRTDNNLSYTASNQGGCDSNVIDGFSGGAGGNQANASDTANLTDNEQIDPPTNTNCAPSEKPITFSDAANFNVYFKWIDAGTIETSDGTTMTFVQDNGKGPFLDTSSTNCRSTLTPVDGKLALATLVIRYSGDNPFPDFSDGAWGSIGDNASIANKNGCQQSKQITVVLGDVNNQQKPAGTGGANGGAATTDPSSLGCEGSSNPLSWVICPVINDLLVPAIDLTDNLITQEMVLPTQDIFCSKNSGSTDTCDAYYTAWASFRNISLGLIAMAGLLIVIAQAIGMEILDAYTIRKMLPRILVAAVAITLSWPLMNFAVTLSNNLGFGIRDLIVAPFHNLSSTINLNFSNGGGFIGGLENFLGGAGLFAGALAAGASIWIITGGLGIILSYVLTAGLAVLIAILVLVLRQIAVIMMILVAPIAIVAYVLPNTQRVFRLWWESFTRALLMFPMIAAFIAAGRVFAAISLTSASNGVGGTLQGLIGFVSYFAPYFLIPLTFRFSGGVMSGLGNAINQRGQGAMGSLRNWRGSMRQNRIARARTSGLYRDDLGRFNYKLRPGGKQRSFGGVGKALNTVGFYTVNGDEMIPMKLGGTRERGGWNLPGFRRGAARDWERIDAARREQTQKALGEINPGYKGGRLLAGSFIGKKHNYLENLSAADRAEFDNHFAVRDSNGEIIRKSDGTAANYRAPDSYKSRMLAADIISRSSDGEAREAATELRTSAGRLESYNLSHETNRVDGRYLGLMAAAKEGRLELEDIQQNHEALKAQGKHAEAQHETVSLQEMATQKRTSQARGHAYEYDEHGNIVSVYANPISQKAMVSIDRQSQDDWRTDKAEDMQGLHGEAWIAALSEDQVEFDPEAQKVKRLGGGSGVLGPDGRPISSGKSRKTEEEINDAKIRQDKFKSMALYHAGDTGMEREMKRIWQAAGLDLRELDRTLAAGAADRGNAPPATPEPEKPPGS